MGQWYSILNGGSNSGCTDILESNFEDGKVCQLWSFMSVTNDQYVWITDEKCEIIFYKVGATGKAEGDTLPLVKITFKEAGEFFSRKWYYMQFQKNNKTFQVQASDKVVKAVMCSDGDAMTKWLPIRMQPPNEAYWAFKSDQGSEDKPLYLSSDGNGNMQLKRANTTHFLPPQYNPNIDPALLFREIDPPV